MTCSFASPDSGRFLTGDNAELIERFVCETCNPRENTRLNAGSPSRGPLQLPDSPLEPEVHEAGALSLEPLRHSVAPVRDNRSIPIGSHFGQSGSYMSLLYAQTNRSGVRFYSLSLQISPFRSCSLPHLLHTLSFFLATLFASLISSLFPSFSPYLSVFSHLPSNYMEA